MKTYSLLLLSSLCLFYKCSHIQTVDDTKKKGILLETKTVTSMYFDNDTLDNQLILYDDSTYSLSYLLHIPDTDNEYGAEIVTDHYTGKAKINRDTIFLANDTLLLRNGYVHFIKNEEVSFIRPIDVSSLLSLNNYDINKYNRYHIIDYYPANISNQLPDKDEFNKLLVMNDSLLHLVEKLIKDTVDKMMPKTIIYNDKPRQLLDNDKKPCCFYQSYYKKMLPYVDNKGHQKVFLFLSLRPLYILEGDFPLLFDGGHYFLDIKLDLTNRKIIHIGQYGYT